MSKFWQKFQNYRIFGIEISKLTVKGVQKSFQTFQKIIFTGNPFLPYRLEGKNMSFTDFKMAQFRLRIVLMAHFGAYLV